MTGQIAVNLEDARFARTALLQWFETHAREFPWRYDHNPYHVLMAEMMLRRTQARQVPEVYRAFLLRYPDVAYLNGAPEEEVSSVLYPLGLHWRAANFKVLARELTSRHNGKIPFEREMLVKLPGVGPYVADAVRCFAYGQMATLADTNTVRVAARYFGFAYTPESRRKTEVVEAISKLIAPEYAAKSNYALLDLAALICKARSPECSTCPLALRCKYLARSDPAT